jgi:hypothetical protein
MILFYKRSGERTSLKKVQAIQMAHAKSFLDGIGPGGITRTKNFNLAKRFATMTPTEFCRETGAFTYRKTEPAQKRP